MVKQVDPTLLNKLKALTQKLKVKQTVQLMESALVQIPTVVGWLRPVILLPASALTGLSSEQLEAIIAHELAHIKRLDYLINILQTVVEILGFYHPAVWWVSYKIRGERENCCDDMAVSISGDRVSYAGALASMEEIRGGASGRLAVAATGGNLFRRICRLLGKDSTDNTGLSWVPAATAILLIIALAIPTTLALTNKTDSLLTETKTDIQVEDDILIETAQDEEYPAKNISTAPMLTTSPAPSNEDKAQVVKANLLVVEVPLDSKIDTETLKEAEKILGGKVSLRNTKANVILRQVAKTTTATKDKSAENKRVTEQQLNSLVKMLDSKGYIKILMNPTIEILNGKTATVKSTQHVPLQQVINSAPGGYIIRRLNKNGYVEVADLIEITPHVFADGHIILDFKADLGSRNIPVFEEPTIPVSIRSLATQVRANPGESLIIGGLTETHLTTGDNINNKVQQANEVLFIITPTIMTPPEDSQEITDTQIERFKKALSAQNLKKLGLAVAMYADDHNDNLPESFQELKPYMRDEQFDWLLDNVEYLNKGKAAQRNASRIPIAYDRTLPEKADGTNVLFLDFHVRFCETKECEKLDINIIRNKFLVEAKFLSVSEDFLQNLSRNADSPDEAKDLSELKSELLAAVDGPNKSTSILPEHNVSLLLKAVRAHKDSKVLATPQVLCREGKSAKIGIFNEEIFYTSGYTEPNNPSDKPQPKIDKVEEGITMSLRPKLTPNKNIDMQFDLEIIKVPGFEEKMYKGKYPYKLPSIQSIDQSTRYIAKDGQTLLFGIHKIADRPDNQTEQKELLVLITTHTIDSSEQDKSAKAENLIVTKPAIIQTRTERPNVNDQEKNKPATKRRRRPARSIDDSLAKIDNEKQVTQIFKLKHHDTSQMARILSPLLTKTGHVSKDERTNSLIVSDTQENLTRIEKILAQYDRPKADETVTEIFEIRNGDPVEIVEILKMLINGRPDTASVIESSNGPILLIPEPKRKWIIAKASTENINQIGQWIKKLDTDKSTMGLHPMDKAVHEQLEMIVDLSDLEPGMSFGEVVEKLENSVEPPLQIQPIWKDLLDNTEVEQATPAGMDPLPHIKLRKALEILLTSVSSTGLPKLTYIVDEGVILIGTADVLPPKMGSRIYDISDPNELRKTTEHKQQPPQIRPKIPKLSFESEESMTPLKQVQKQLDELIKQRQATKATEPNLPITPKVSLISETFIDCPLIDALQSIAAAADITIIPDETVTGLVSCRLKDVTVEKALDSVLAGTPYVWKKTKYYYLVASENVMFAQMSETRRMQMNYVTAEAAVGLLSTAFRDYVQAEIAATPGTETYTVVVTAPPALAERIISDLKQIDKVRLQVLLDARIESAKKLSNLGKALLIYANDHNDKYPDSLFRTTEFHQWQDYRWIMKNVEYLASGKTLTEPPDIPIAYDKTLLKEGKGTNVLYNDCHVSFEKVEKLKKLAIGDSKILIDTNILSVSEDFLKDVGLDPNSIHTSGPWSQHLTAKYPAEPNSEIYSLILDDLHVTFLLKALSAHKDAHIIASPQVLCLEGKPAEIHIMAEERYFKDYNEPNSLPGEPKPKLDKVEIGTHLWLKPILTPDTKNVDLNLKLENTRLRDIIESKYKGKYPTYKPIVEVISLKMPGTIPGGKTMLIGGLKIDEHTKKEPRHPQLKDLPLIGAAFRSDNKIKDQKMLLILVKPIINPEQKATKILPGQEDSEKDIKRIAEQLDKKINPPNKFR